MREDHPAAVLERVPLGALKADPVKLLACYFDVHLYLANCGSRRLMFRLPKQAVDVSALRPYLPGDPVGLNTTKGHVILDLRSETEEPVTTGSRPDIWPRR